MFRRIGSTRAGVWCTPAYSTCPRWTTGFRTALRIRWSGTPIGNSPLPTRGGFKLTWLIEPNWVLSALMLGVSEEAVDFTPYIEEEGAAMTVGELRIRTESIATMMKMFDGQHRRRAVKDVLKELQADMRRSEKLADLRSCSLPIMLYVEDRIPALRQMFADAAQTKSIEKNVTSAV